MATTFKGECERQSGKITIDLSAKFWHKIYIQLHRRMHSVQLLHSSYS